MKDKRPAYVFNAMAADTLASCIARASAIMLLT